jgi:hypothetical protein
LPLNVSHACRPERAHLGYRTVGAASTVRVNQDGLAQLDHETARQIYI